MVGWVANSEAMSRLDFDCRSYTERNPESLPVTKEIPLPVGSRMGRKSGPVPEVSCVAALVSRLYSQRLIIPLRSREKRRVLPGSPQLARFWLGIAPRSAALWLATFTLYISTFPFAFEGLWPMTRRSAPSGNTRSRRDVNPSSLKLQTTFPPAPEAAACKMSLVPGLM